MLILLNLCRFALTQDSEKIFYVNDHNDFVVLLDERVDVKKQVYGNGSYNETFIFTSTSGFKYALTVTKDYSNNLTNNSLSTAKFIESFINDCGCEFLSFEHRDYNNVSTIQFKIQRFEDGKSLVGFSDFVIYGKYLYNVVFLAFENSFSLYENSYSEIMNTLIINE